MKLQDILFDRSEYRFLFGEHYADRELGGIHLLSTIHDLPHMTPSSLLFVMPSFFTAFLPLSRFLSLAIQSSVAGIALIDPPELPLSDAVREQLCSHRIFILSLPAAVNYHSILQLQSKAQTLEDLPARARFRQELAAICAGPYTGHDIAVLLNQRIGHPVDLIVGKDLHSLIQHNTLGISNVTMVISRNLERIMAEKHPQIYSYFSSKALVIRIERLYAFLAIPLEARHCLTDLEYFYIEEAIPYIALAITRRIVPLHIHSASDFYLGMLRGTLTMDSLSLRETASLFGIQHDMPRYVWILDWKHPVSNNIGARLSAEVTSRFPGSFAHQLANRLVILSPAAQLYGPCQTPTKALNEFLTAICTAYPNLMFQISLSKSCANLEQVKNAYSEAKFAMIIGPELNPGQNIYCYQTYILYHILCNSWGKPILQRLYARYVVPLSEYDQKNGTELLPTLEQLASQAFHLARTAEHLQIHRNTLYRRIQKIGSILDCDMSATESHVLLYIALLVGRIISIFPQTESDVSWTI